MTDFLLEIGCEELPADYMPAALNWGEQGGLASAAAAAFKEAKIPWTEIRLFGSPRRLVLVAHGIPPVIERTEEGPPVQIAFDGQGKPTRAAESFAQKHNVPVGKLARRQTPKGERLVLERSIPVAELLEEAVPAIVGGIPFPKTMRWDASGVRFARPVRWLLALYGSKRIACSFGGTIGGGCTITTRRAGAKPVPVKETGAYRAALKKAGITLEEGQHVRRTEDGPEPLPPKTPKRDALLAQLRAAAKKLGGRLADETTEEFIWLLNTVTFLAEDPVVAVGSFRPEYLDLPSEVLSTSMAKHLKLFGVFDASGAKLLPKFLAVLEGRSSDEASVMANYERIIEARFTDARFFYREDSKTKLSDKQQVLSKVVFHEKLGSVKERVDHLPRLMNKIVSDAELPVDRVMVQRAAMLCKADLVTQMVREFPSLQGVIGGHYARHDKEPDEVARAIAEQYKPRTAADPGPSSALGALLSIADRLDTLIGYFGAGMKPTGSLDPYGLRRQATGLVRILVEPPEKLSFAGLSIDRLFDEGIQSWGSRLAADPSTLKKELRAFLRERFEWLAFTARGIDRELIAAVLAAGDDDLAGAWERLQVLQALWKDKKAEGPLVKAAKVAERTGRIVKSVKNGHELGAVDPAALKEAPEKKLWDAWNKTAPVLREQVGGRRYRDAISTYAQLYPEVHDFFDKVFVMDEDLAVRRNRLSFMNEIFTSLSGSFADLSKLPLAGIEPSS